LERVKKYRLKNKERVIQYYKSERRREVAYRANMKRRSRKHKVDFTPLQRKEILYKYDWTCQSCGCKVHDRRTGNWNTPDKAHLDHIIPISKGGNSEPDNIQVLCRTCNLSKHAKIENTNNTKQLKSPVTVRKKLCK